MGSFFIELGRFIFLIMVVMATLTVFTFYIIGLIGLTGELLRAFRKRR